MYKVFLCPLRVCLPSPVKVLQSNPTGLQNQIPWGFSVPLLDPQVWKSVVDPRTCTKVRELLWCNCSPVCGSSAQQLCSGANGDLLQKNLCHMPCLPGLLQPEPRSLWQTTADPCLRGRHFNTQSQVWLSLLRGCLHLSLGPGAH